MVIRLKGLILVLGLLVITGCKTISESEILPSLQPVQMYESSTETAELESLKIQPVFRDKDGDFPEGSLLNILDVFGNLVLCSLNQQNVSGGYWETTEILVYNMDDAAFRLQEKLKGMMVIHGALYDGGYVFTELEAGTELLADGFVIS